MCSAQHHARRVPCLQRFLPSRCAQAPAITGLQSRKAEFRDRRREIIAAGLRIFKKSRGHDGAHGVAADVLAAGVAASIAKKTRHRAQGADFESIAQHVLGLASPAAAALARVISQHRDSLHRRSFPCFDNVHCVLSVSASAYPNARPPIIIRFRRGALRDQWDQAIVSSAPHPSAVSGSYRTTQL